MNGAVCVFLLEAGLKAAVGSNAPGAGQGPRAEPFPGAVDYLPTLEHPVGWRGDGRGQHSAAHPVTRWSAEENVRWKAEVGPGHSSPLVVGERLLVTAEPDHLVCLDAGTGRELWRKAHPIAGMSAEAAAKGAKHSSQYGDATPTPVTDGRRVWVFFGTGIVACHDLDGRSLWMNWYDLRQTTPYGRTASPVLVGERLLVHFGPLVCLEASTGKGLWTNDQARATYGTPVVVRLGEVNVAITPKGQVVRVADGRMLAADLGNCMYPSPVVQDRVAFFLDGAMTAVQLPAQAADPIEARELWSGDLTGEFFASPLVYDGRVYTVDKAATYYVIEASTGKIILTKKLALPRDSSRENASVYPSLCLAGKHLFVGNDAGDMIVLEPGDQGVVVGSGRLPGGSGATPAFSGGRVFVRGGKSLYCLAAP